MMRFCLPWATGQNYEPAAIATFLQVADYWLIAHAKAHEFIVVTHVGTQDKDPECVYWARDNLRFTK